MSPGGSEFSVLSGGFGSLFATRVRGRPAAGQADEYRSEKHEHETLNSHLGYILAAGGGDHSFPFSLVSGPHLQENVHGGVEVGDEVVGPGGAQGVFGEGAPAHGDAGDTGGFRGGDVEG